MTATESEIPADATAPQPIKGWVVLASPLLGMVLFVIVGALAFAAYAIPKGTFDPEALRELVSRTAEGGYYIAMGLSDAFYLSFLFAMWLLLPKRGPASLASYFPRVSGKALGTGIAVGVGMAFLIGPALYLASEVLHVDIETTPGEMMMVPKSVLELVAVLIAGAVIAPIVEEVFFRGLLLRWLRRWMWLVLAVAIDAVLFAVVHGRFLTHAGLGGIVVTAALMVPGIVLAILAIRTKSLWPGILAHGVYNGILLTFSFFAPNAT